MAVNLSSLLRETTRMFRDPDRKPLAEVARELVAWRRTRETHPREYFHLGLYRRSAGDPRAYVGSSEWRAIVRSWRTDEAAQAFRDKVAFHRTVSQLGGVRQPRHLGAVEAGVFTDADGRTTAIRSRADLAAAIRAANVDDGDVFLKPAGGREGKGAFRLGASALDALPEAVWAAVGEQAYTIEEVVRQHEALRAIHPESLNTVRFVTCRPEGGAPAIVGAFLRVGSGGRPVDNVGGLFAPLDVDTGRLAGPFQRTSADGGGAFERHPDTGVAARDVVVPHLAEAVGAVCHVASAFDYPVVGWDIGASPSGPVLIEGNDWPGYTKLQAATGGLLANPTFLAFLRTRPIWPDVQAWSGVR